MQFKARKFLQTDLWSGLIGRTDSWKINLDAAARPLFGSHRKTAAMHFHNATYDSQGNAESATMLTTAEE
jgi:hypothetical protein